LSASTPTAFTSEQNATRIAPVITIACAVGVIPSSVSAHGSAIKTFKGGFDRPADAYDPEYPHLASALRAAGDDDIDDLGLAAVVAWLEQVEAKTTQG
jgi:hypothetical protein